MYEYDKITYADSTLSKMFTITGVCPNELLEQRNRMCAEK